MKKIRFVISLCIFALLIPVSLWAAIASTAVWEIEQNATAGNVNSCFFNPSEVSAGTDWSGYPTCKVSWAASGGTCAQTSAQNVTNDLTCTTTNPAVCSSASYSFTSADVGNSLLLISGTNLTTAYTRAEIVSVAAGSATLDKQVATVAAIGIAANMGGACSLNSANGATDQLLLNSLIPGNTVFVKYNAASYIIQYAELTSQGTDLARISFIGYNITRGDAPQTIYRPVIIDQYLQLANDWDFFNLIFDLNGTRLNGGIHNYFQNVKFISSTGTSQGFWDGGNSSFINIEATNPGGTAFLFNDISILWGSYIHDSVDCVIMTYGQDTVAFSIIARCSNSGIHANNYPSQSDNYKIFNNTLYGGETPTGTGFLFDNYSPELVLSNNIIYGWATGISMPNRMAETFEDYNDFYNNTTDRVNVSVGTHDLALNPQFTSPSTNNFSIGTNLKAMGFPGYIPATNSTGYMDTGAVQRQESSGGGGGSAHSTAY